MLIDLVIGLSKTGLISIRRLPHNHDMYGVLRMICIYMYG